MRKNALETLRDQYRELRGKRILPPGTRLIMRKRRSGIASSAESPAVSYDSILSDLPQSTSRHIDLSSAMRLQTAIGTTIASYQRPGSIQSRF